MVNGLAFSSPASFWSQTGVFLSEHPHRLGFNLTRLHDVAPALDTLTLIQDRIFEHTSGRVDLSECLAWQRQFAILGGTPQILSTSSLLGRFRAIPQPKQEALHDLSAFYLEGKPDLGNMQTPSLFVRRRLEEIRLERSAEEAKFLFRANGILGKAGPDLVTLAFQVHHAEALLRCDYHDALLSAFSLYGYSEGRSQGPMHPELVRELLIPISFANTADALGKNDWARAAKFVGFSLIHVDGMDRTKLVETNAWFVDVATPYIKDLSDSSLTDGVIRSVQQEDPQSIRPFVLGLGLCLLLSDPERHRELWPRLAQDFL